MKGGLIFLLFILLLLSVLDHLSKCLSCLNKIFSETTVPIRVITKLPNSEQSYKGKVKTHNYTNRQNQSTREFDAKWTGEIFKVTQRIMRGGLPIYRLKDFHVSVCEMSVHLWFNRLNHSFDIVGFTFCMLCKQMFDLSLFQKRLY
jgi:hypothetical protein